MTLWSARLHRRRPPPRGRIHGQDQGSWRVRVRRRRGQPGSNDDIGEAKRLELYRSQVVLRQAEQRAFDLFLQNLVKGTSHLSLGQEAIAAGFACAMKKGDLTFCTYRGHAHTLARGVPVEKVLGELMQRDNGLMRGKGGSMHLTSEEHGVMGSYAIIGAHLPIACGAALTAQYKGQDFVSVCFFGDGTTNIGAFHEALNFAAIWKLPVIFVCENNLYMEYTPIHEVTAVEHPAADRASAYGLDKIVIDGNDADVVYRTAQTAFAKARAGGGPSLIECLTYRHSGHSRADPAKYRPEGELERWKEKDPIKVYRERLKQFGIRQSVIDDIDKDVAAHRRRGDGSLQGRPECRPPTSYSRTSTQTGAGHGGIDAASVRTLASSCYARRLEPGAEHGAAETETRDVRRHRGACRRMSSARSRSAFCIRIRGRRRGMSRAVQRARHTSSMEPISTAVAAVLAAGSSMRRARAASGRARRSCPTSPGWRREIDCRELP